MFLNRGHVALTAVILIASGRSITGSTPFTAKKQSQILRTFALRRRLQDDPAREPGDVEADDGTPITPDEIGTGTVRTGADDTAGTETGEDLPTATTDGLSPTTDAPPATDGLPAGAMEFDFLASKAEVSTALEEEEELKNIVLEVFDDFNASDGIDEQEQAILLKLKNYDFNADADLVLTDPQLELIDGVLDATEFTAFKDGYMGDPPVDFWHTPTSIPIFGWFIVGGSFIALAIVLAVVWRCKSGTTPRIWNGRRHSW